MGSVIVFMISAAIVGLVAYLLTTFVPMPDQVKQLIVIGAVLLVLLVLLSHLGVHIPGLR